MRYEVRAEVVLSLCDKAKVWNIYGNLGLRQSQFGILKYYFIPFLI